MVARAKLLVLLHLLPCEFRGSVSGSHWRRSLSEALLPQHWLLRDVLPATVLATRRFCGRWLPSAQRVWRAARRYPRRHARRPGSEVVLAGGRRNGREERDEMARVVHRRRLCHARG